MLFVRLKRASKTSATQSLQGVHIENSEKRTETHWFSEFYFLYFRKFSVKTFGVSLPVPYLCTRHPTAVTDAKSHKHELRPDDCRHMTTRIANVNLQPTKNEEDMETIRLIFHLMTR